MGLSRRMFSKEFKRAAIQRLEQGVSLGEVARALEVNPNVLHRWRREFSPGVRQRVSGDATRVGSSAHATVARRDVKLIDKSPLQLNESSHSLKRALQ